MSKFDSDDVSIPGYFLPEDSHSRLKKLRDHMAFLSRLAQPRTWKEQEYALDVPAAELAMCLASLAEQGESVLQELSWPAQREGMAAEASENDDAPADSPLIADAAAERFSFGVTLDQMDALDRLIQTISAQGDVVASSHTAEFADRTLPRIGQAIYDGAEVLRAILGEVQTQPLRPRTPLNRVGETRAVYAAGFAGSAARSGAQPGFGHGVKRALQ